MDSGVSSASSNKTGEKEKDREMRETQRKRDAGMREDVTQGRKREGKKERKKGRKERKKEKKRKKKGRGRMACYGLVAVAGGGQSWPELARDR